MTNLLQYSFKELEKVRITNPLHVPGTERGIKNAKETFPDVPVMVMSDSEALTCETRKDADYALPKEIVAPKPTSTRYVLNWKCRPKLCAKRQVKHLRG